MGEQESRRKSLISRSTFTLYDNGPDHAFVTTSTEDVTLLHTSFRICAGLLKIILFVWSSSASTIRLTALFIDYTWDTEATLVDAVFTVKHHGNGEYTIFIPDYCLNNVRHRQSHPVIGRSFRLDDVIGRILHCFGDFCFVERSASTGTVRTE